MRIWCQPKRMEIPPQQPEEDAHPQCQSIGGTHHIRGINESATQNPSRWFRGCEVMDTSTTTPKIELVVVTTGYLEAAATTETMLRMTVRGNGIKNG